MEFTTDDVFRFFNRVDPSLLKKPSFNQFIAMVDNFNTQTGVAEPRVSVQEEQQEISAFLNTVLASRPWQKLYSFLDQRNKGTTGEIRRYKDHRTRSGEIP
ncbi:hypothetical protein ANCDUO_22032 [Ancylostoma duodenale]|uniref:EndoU domain-containing protein n=1 Tax=Ancylostoma duodenale TaxID=51022 RepID=A0A0C2BVE8_9BILA|nr:hypothetical protein ANCDUO_22032 [Ancylostoma duodenale]